MGSAIHHVGPLGSAALVKLSTNALMGVQVTVLAELIGLLERSGADAATALKASPTPRSRGAIPIRHPRTASRAIASTAAWSPAANYLSGSMLANNFAAQFPVELIEKDFGYTEAVAGSSEAVPTIAAARKVFQSAIAKGHARENMTSVVRLFTEPK
jgi:3-hydroxyisobutyrate dehydrogenase